MEHAEFVDARERRTIAVSIDRRKALKAVFNGPFPLICTLLHVMLTVLWALSFPAALVVTAFFDVWAGMAFLMLAPFMYAVIDRQLIAYFVITRAVDSAEFYAAAVAEGIITTRAKRWYEAMS